MFVMVHAIKPGAPVKIWRCEHAEMAPSGAIHMRGAVPELGDPRHPAPQLFYIPFPGDVIELRD
jgi:hypothetical protein